MVKLKFLAGLVGVFLFCLVVSHVYAARSSEAQDAIDKAESKMGLVYKSVLKAEAVGADVSGLLFKLNNSSMLLSMAQMQNRVGNLSEAVNFANQCYDSLHGIETEADDLRESAVILRQQRMLISTVGSVFVIGAVCCASVFGWHFFKSKYCKRVLEMKPEVQADDSE